MAGTTTKGFRYPTASDAPAIHTAFLNLATDVDTFLDTPQVTTSVIFEGSTADAYETTLTVIDPTADRTITLPNVSGTVLTSGNLDAITAVTGATITSPTITGAVFNDGSVVFEGTTTDAFETTLVITDPTADRAITFQDATGTVVLRDSTDTLTNKTLTSPVVSGLTLSDASIILEGATADNFETTLTVADPTADRIITLPDVTGTVITTGDTATVSATMLAQTYQTTALAATADTNAQNFSRVTGLLFGGM